LDAWPKLPRQPAYADKLPGLELDLALRIRHFRHLLPDCLGSLRSPARLAQVIGQDRLANVDGGQAGLGWVVWMYHSGDAMDLGMRVDGSKDSRVDT
jgi:hypothetical protein